MNKQLRCMLVFLMLITLYVLYSLYTLVHLRVLLNWATGRRNVPRCNLHLNILSARENFDERNTVRKTWGKTFPRYHFFVGNQSCTSQSTLLNPITCAPVRFATRSVSLEDLHLQSRLSSILEEEIKWEATEFHDVVLLPMTDSFHNLAQKLLLTWEWTIRNVPQSSMIITLNDDIDESVVWQISRKVCDVLKIFDWESHGENVIVGTIITDFVQRTGKYADLHYQNESWWWAQWPPFPRGVNGYAVSTKLAKLVLEHKEMLPTTSGDDTSVGLWLQELETRHNVSIKWVQTGERVPLWMSFVYHCMVIMYNAAA